ncbi:hypothetical protein BC826DRAFT_1105016 [Russula brevipes]|nr:hypothetical protein BC826DRAFT_1105016 [Russula brevipes]
MSLPPHRLLQFPFLPFQRSPQVRLPPSLASHRLRALSQEHLPSCPHSLACLPGLPHPVSRSLQGFLQGNAALKGGDYVAAIGHYAAAALADPSDPTFFLNLSDFCTLAQNEDAERDCTTVLSPSNNKSVKALFRRAQARVALQNLGEAHNGLQTALKLEPNNEAVKAELARVRGLIVNRKGKTVTRSAPIEVTTPLPAPAPLSLSPTAPPKRRRVPITIVEGSGGPSWPSPSASDAQPTDDLLNPISMRLLTPSTTLPDQPNPPSFREAKQVREAKSAGRVGGGIFRMSGNDTLFKTREVPTPAYAPAVADPPNSCQHQYWRQPLPRQPAIAPPSFPALFGSSLEPALLASFVPVLASASAPAAAPERHEAASRDAVMAFMAERSAARAVWEAVVQSTGNDSAEVEEAARMWGFTDASASA